MPDFTRIKKLGEGNFGEVWLAKDRAVGQKRAVKFIKDTGNLLGTTDFYHEPKTLTKLSSPYIVSVKDAGIYNGSLYISMEYLAKGSYQDLLDKNEYVGLKQAVRAICDVCRALEYAHGRNFIHRDVKPGNILIGPSHSKLSDFGLATRVNSTGAADAYGYLFHLAPEAFRIGESTKLSDIYAAAVTLYRMVNGEALLKRQWSAAIQDDIEKGRFPRRDKYQPFVSPALRRIINKAMNVDPAKRYQSAAQFRNALEQVFLAGDWHLVSFSSHDVWRCHTDTCEYTMQVSKEKNKRGLFDFELRKASPGGKARRNNRESQSFESPTELNLHMSDVMGRITSGAL